MSLFKWQSFQVVKCVTSVIQESLVLLFLKRNFDGHASLLFWSIIIQAGRALFTLSDFRIGYQPMQETGAGCESKEEKSMHNLTTRMFTFSDIPDLSPEPYCVWLSS